ncbi:MAG: tetratricopeptide repeat protein, partial [Thermoguttaceae bacterium]
MRNVIILSVIFFCFYSESVIFAQTAEHASAAYESGDYKSAFELYRKVRESEPDFEARQNITARIIQCLQYLGEPEEAGKEFINLCRNEPNTKFLEIIPLVWFTNRSASAVGLTSEEKLALDWINPQSNPSGVDNYPAALMAASVLLGSPQNVNRQKAVERLEALSSTQTTGLSDEKVKIRKLVAKLAAVQLWRIKIPTLKT